jgi:Bacteriophage tail sheath protein
MPEYLAPGVYVEETSFRSKSIEGVSTTTTGFVGPARYGPIDIEPEVITSVTEFERTFGDRERLQFKSYADTDNYVWHAASAYFEEGGKRLYVARVFRGLGSDGTAIDYERPVFDIDTAFASPPYSDGHARAELTASLTSVNYALRVFARFPGEAGNVRVRFVFRVGASVLGTDSDGKARVAVQEKDVVVINRGSDGGLYEAQRYFDTLAARDSWKFVPLDDGGTEIRLTDLIPDHDPTRTPLVRVVTMTVKVTPTKGGIEQVWDSLALNPKHERSGSPDSLTKKFAADPSSIADARTLPIVIAFSNDLADGGKVLRTLTAYEPLVLSPPGDKTMPVSVALLVKPVANLSAADQLHVTQPTEADLSVDVVLVGGNDGERPSADDYKGREKNKRKSGLVAFEDIEDISIVAAPGSTYRLNNGYRADGSSILNNLIAHATRMRYRIAVLDSGDNQSISEVRELRGKIDSTYAALYYPWVRILDPVTGTERNMPPSGFVAGIYARNDINRAVYKAPANEVVFSAIGFETLLNKSQQDVLNPEGINCFRFFSGRGFRLWGARTISSDPEWKYVNLRRYFAYLEHSIDRGTQWAVFEPNGEALWANVRRTIEDFLLNEWQMGALLGDKPEKAFFVKCDRSTMSQNDLDNGRMVCLVGVAPLRPAEYVIFRIGQWTADRKV